MLAGRQRGWQHTLQSQDTYNDCLLLTPRFGNEFLFDKGQGVMVRDRSELIDLLKDFGTAVTAGEFDMRIMEIARGRGARTQRSGGRRGRPRKNPLA